MLLTGQYTQNSVDECCGDFSPTYSETHLLVLRIATFKPTIRAMYSDWEYHAILTSTMKPLSTSRTRPFVYQEANVEYDSGVWNERIREAGGLGFLDLVIPKRGATNLLLRVKQIPHR
jgi:hypothetical protein